MSCKRRSSDRPRREILCGDLDRLISGRRLWGERAEVDLRAERRSRAVREAVASALTDKQRQVVEAYFFEGLSQGEIARRLGITQQVVQKRLYGAPRGGRLVGGAISRLREVLSPLFASQGPSHAPSRKPSHERSNEP